MTRKNVYGHTKSGAEIDDEMIERLAAEAEAGFDVDLLLARRGKRGRPSLGVGESAVESFRLDNELRMSLIARAESEGVPVSEILRRAVREYLKAG